MNLCSGRASVPAAGSISSSKNYNYAKNSNKRSEKNQMDILGFHPSQGVGGVIGVVAGDCIAGIIHEPERYARWKNRSVF